ncbi:MAG: LLM class F420-dependent oxidoreductase [Acidimicrobiia bacterium]
MRIAVQLHPQHATFDAIRRAVVRAEEMGVDVAYNWDHFYPLYGDGDGRHFECWTMLGSWAEVTERIRIGPLVTCNSYRNPQLLADMARTVDHASEGRAILGIGAGWFEKDYNEYGYSFGTAPDRLRALEAALPVIEDRIAKLNPPPLGPLPILIGGGGEKVTLRLVARHADIWHGFGTPTEYAHKMEVLDAWCAKLGRNPEAIERSAGAKATEPESGAALMEAGADEITLGFEGPDFDMAPVAEWLAWRDEVNG